MEFINFLVYLYNAFNEFIQQIHPQIQEDFYD